MKRKLLVAVLVLLATLLVGGAALAITDPILCEMEVSPSTLSEPGEVTVTISISNSGDTDMQEPLTLYSPTSDKVTDFGDNGTVTLKAGEVKTWTGTWNVNQQTLKNGQIVFFAKYVLVSSTGERETKSQQIRGKLEVSEATTDVEIRRTISPGTAREGQEVTVKYDIVNTGTTTLKNLVLEENKDISAKSTKIDGELKAGDAAQLKYTVKMGKKNLTSSATLTYTAGSSSDKLTEKVGEQQILYGEAFMTAKLTASSKGVPINGTVTLTLELKNEGSVDYTKILVSDPTLGDVFTNQELKSGGTLTLEKEITLTKTTDYQFTITAIDNTGTEVSLSTDSLTLTAVDPNNVLHLNVVASADRTEVYTQPGIVRFTITVENDSNVDAKDVDIYHGKVKIYTFASIPAGQSRKLTRDAALSMAGKYQFTAVTVDALSNSDTFSSNEIQIAFSVPTPAPATATPPLVPTPEPTYAAITVPPISDPSVGTVAKYVRMVFYPLMIVGLILLAGASVLLVLATKKRIEQRKASEAALDHLDRAKRRDYVSPGDEPETDTEPDAPAAPVREREPVTRTGGKSASTGNTGTKESATPAKDAELPHMKYVRNAYQRNGNGKSDNFRNSSLYDEDPMTMQVGATDKTEEQEEPYHTYGSDRELYELSSAAATPPVPPKTGKDWSAYTRPAAVKPEENMPGKASAASYPVEDETEAGYSAAGYADSAGYEPYTQDAGYPADASYADGGTYPAYPEDSAYNAQTGAYDEYTGYEDQADAYTGQDGYVTDPLGYGDPAAYPDGQAAYDGSAGYYDPKSGYGDDAGYPEQTGKDGSASTNDNR